MSSTIAEAYVQVIPSLKGAQRSIESQLGGIDVSKSGSKLGSSLGSSLFGRLGKVANIGSKAVIGTIGGIGAAVSAITVQGGISRALNIENAQHKLRALGMDVDAVMKSVQTAVKGTAYGLDAAATVASSLAASGVKAGDEMTSSLQAVAGMASTSGRSMEQVGLIFGKVAAQGRLQGDELMQFAESGVNATAALANYLGKSQSEIRDMVRKGKIDFQTFSDAMYATFGEAAYGANETFSGAMMNVRAALSRVGAAFAAPALRMGQQVFAALIPIIDSINASLQPAVSAFTSFTEEITPKIINAMTVIGGEIQKFAEGGIQNLTLYGVVAEKLAVPFANLQSFIAGLIGNFRAGKTPIESFSLALATVKNKIIDIVNNASLEPLFELIKTEVAKLPEPLQNVANAVINFVTSGNAALVAFGGAFAVIAAKLAPFHGLINALVPKFMEFGAIVKTVFANASIAGGGITGLVSTISQLNVVTTAVKGAMTAILSPATLIIAAVAAVGAGFAYMMVTSEDFRSTVMNLVQTIGASLAPILLILATNFRSLAAQVLPQVRAIFMQLAPVLGQIGVVILQIISVLAPLITQLMGALVPAITTVVSVVMNIITSIMPAITGIASLVISLIQAALPVISMILTVVVSVITGVISTLSAFASFVGSCANIVIGVISTIISAVTSILTIVVDIFGAILGFVSEVLASIVAVISGAFNTAMNTVSLACNFISGVVSAVVSAVGSFFGSMASTINTSVQNAYSYVSSAFNNIKSAISTVCSGILGTVTDGFSSAVSYIQGLASDAWNWGADIINNLIGGIQSMIGSLTSSVSGIAGTISSFLHFSEPDVGPLSNFHTYMPDMMHGLADGMTKNLSVVRKASTKVADVMSDSLNKDASFNLKANVFDTSFNSDHASSKEQDLLNAIANSLDKLSETKLELYLDGEPVYNNVMRRLDRDTAGYGVI